MERSRTGPGAARLLSDLVAIDSVNPSLVPGAAGEAEIALFVTEWLRRAGLDVEVQEVAPGRPNIIARLRRGKGRRLILNAHMDTVGVEGMQFPFAPRIEGDRLYGRGAYDMKGGLAAIMLAAGNLLHRRDFAGEVIVTAVADEEYASLGTQRVAETVQADGAVVTEPTELRLCVAHKGFAWLRVETRGRAAHGSKPDLGVDAIAHMGRVLRQVENIGRRLDAEHGHPLLGPGSIHASLIQGGQELSSYPERCVLQVERRTVPGETPAMVRRELETALEAERDDPQFSGDVALMFWREPFEAALDHPVVLAVAAAAECVTGNRPEVYGDTPWMDAALLAAAGIPSVVFGPGGEGAHAAVEYGSIQQVALASRVLTDAAVRFCGGT